MYYLGASAIPVKPVTRRVTFTRGQVPKVCRKYLQKTGRKPLNRIGYPTMGTPVAADLAMQPGHFGSVNDPILLGVQTRAGRKFITRPYDPASSVSLGSSVNDPIVESVRTRSGRLIATRPYDPYSAVGGPLDDLVTGYTSQFSPMLTAPAVPSVIAAPVSAPSPGFLSNLMDSLPSWLRNVQVKVNPQQVVSAVQQVFSPRQAGNAMQMLNQAGVQVDYRGVPITPGAAQYGYQVAGVNIMAYLPWVIGGGVALLVLPMLMGTGKK